MIDSEPQFAQLPRAVLEDSPFLHFEQGTDLPVAITMTETWIRPDRAPPMEMVSLERIDEASRIVVSLSPAANALKGIVATPTGPFILSATMRRLPESKCAIVQHDLRAHSLDCINVVGAEEADAGCTTGRDGFQRGMRRHRRALINHPPAHRLHFTVKVSDSSDVTRTRLGRRALRGP